MPSPGAVDFLNFQAVTTVGSSQRTDAINLNGNVPVGLIQPSSQLVSTSITFEVAQGSTYTYYPLVSSTGGAITITTSTQAGQQYRLDPYVFMGVNYVKCVMASSQDGTKTMTWVTRPIA